jgi:glycosyltransferase involved in cell wall biosynthesis
MSRPQASLRRSIVVVGAAEAAVQASVDSAAVSDDAGADGRQSPQPDQRYHGEVRVKASAQISVVVPSFNAATTLPRQLEALAKQECDRAFEVVVADNGSTDGTLAIADEFRDRIPQFVLVDASARRGQAYARNAGARVATGDTLLFVDADDEVEPGYIAAMADALDRHEFVAARFDSDTLNPGWVRGTRQAFQTESISDTFGFRPFAGGGGLGIKRRVFEQVGGFDEDYWRSGQDIDFCWRVQATGASLHFVPDAVARIAWRASLVGLYRQGRHYGRGEVYLYTKYRDAGMPAQSIGAAVGDWRSLARRLPRVRTKAELGGWLRRAGRSVGRAQGSLRHRVRYL